MLGAVLIARFVSWIGSRITRRIDERYTQSDDLVRSEATKHRHSVAQVVTWMAISFVYIVATLKVFDYLQLPIGSLVAPATVLGAALGFGAQRIVQDILAGFFIITERQYGFGDTVQISVTGASEDAIGTVEDVTLRVTRVRSTAGEVITVPNGQINKAVNLSKDWARAVVDVPIPVTADIADVTEMLRELGVAAYKEPRLRELLLDEPSVMGVESLEVDQLSVRMVARTLPGKQFQVGRLLRARIARALRERGITVTPQLDTASVVDRVEAQ
ncbi:mechanosensitive ion channel family protein [Rhodococcus sp. D-6]|uniref:Mechanosensitive ion channel family protein n=1 Tax=Rhodococcus sp. D-6 TaxID=1387842 RepID=A0AAU7V461_9NOCA|nr:MULTISPECIES: mechanosensitive ion channel family protein [Rhodococcus]MCD2139482.1 mechanosensitive ion channel family protein [Rhodococcus pyridinivorans]MCW3470032.1 mechanosensitive ion channel family protein [Rhodococcus pyridinivorans]UPK66095.1 mechanosensitive ion channel family protein [Rhodococcus pyridinivorans]UTM39505.1 mechanosensitive ion channel family protein [Rhodococcus pyridinivorans]